MEDFGTGVPEMPAPRRRRMPADEDDDLRDDPEADRTAQRARRRATRPRVRPDEQGPRIQQRKDRRHDGGIIALLKDTRLHMAVGIILCMMAIGSVVMCVSFMASNWEDQSVTSGRSATEIVQAGDTVANAGNAIGSKFAHLMVVDTLGVGSLAVAVLVFMLGLRCLKKCRVSFWPLAFRCIFTAVALSIIIGLACYGQALSFPPGGIHGQYVNQILMSYSGALGAYGVSLLLLGLLVTVYLKPIQAVCAAAKRIMPKRAAQPQPEDSPEPAGPTFGTLDAMEPADTDDSPAEFVDDNADNGAMPHQVPATAAAIPPANLDQLGPDEGFSIDELPSMAAEPETAVVQPAAPERTMPADDDAAGITIADTEDDGKVDGQPADMPEKEPEMIIKVAEPQSAPVSEPEPIENGSHIGLDNPYDPRAQHSAYVFPPLELLRDRPDDVEVNSEEQAANKQMIVKALHSYNIEIVRIEATIGPTVTLYEIVPAEGIRINKIKSLEDDIAMSLSAIGIRIIAPIPGRGTIGIEVPNRKKQTVPMRRVIGSAEFRAKRTKMHLPVALGSTISNDIYIEDLTKMPHLLVAGATGQGKSVGLNCLITSLLYAKHPDELKFVLVDPKMVEFSLYRSISNAFMAKLPDEENAIITDPQKALATLNSLCVEMDRRYDLLSDALVREIESYNEKFTARRLNPEKGHRYMPYIVVIVDEFADLINTAGKEIFLPIARIAQKGRAAGLHMVIATQRPSTDVITGMIKANFPARIAFRVLSSIDSKTILDRPGAQRLIGRGDMLTFINGATERVQCAFVDTDECEEICRHIGSQPGFTAPYELPEPPSEDGSASTENVSVNVHNEEFQKCALYTALQANASITILQRKFGIGFTKAARYMDQMEALGIVSGANGSKPRQVLMTPESVQMLFSNNT